MTRLVKEDDLQALTSEISALTDNVSVRTVVEQSYRLLVELEMRQVGRFAGTTSNILGKLSMIAGARHQMTA